jgi:hypothetical protein
MKLFAKGKYFNPVQKAVLSFAILYGLIKLVQNVNHTSTQDIILFFVLASFIILIYIGEQIEK